MLLLLFFVVVVFVVEAVLVIRGGGVADALDGGDCWGDISGVSGGPCVV